MPMMSKTLGKEKPVRTVREIEEIIETIEQYLQQTRDVLDRIDVDIAEMKRENRILREKEGVIHPKKDPVNEMGMKL